MPRPVTVIIDCWQRHVVTWLCGSNGKALRVGWFYRSKRLLASGWRSACLFATHVHESDKQKVDGIARMLAQLIQSAKLCSPFTMHDEPYMGDGEK